MGTDATAAGPDAKAAALQVLADLAKAKTQAEAAATEADYRLRAAVYHYRHHGGLTLDLAEIGQAIDRSPSRPSRWCLAIDEDRDGIRAKMGRVLGYDPVTAYHPPQPPDRGGSPP